MHAGQEVVVEWEEGGSRDKTQRETEEEKERHERARRGSDWRSMVGGRWSPKPGSDLSVVCSPPRAPHAKRDMDPGMACGLVWMGATHAHQTQTNNEPQLLAPSLIRLLLPPPTGTRQDGERNHLWEVVFNILVTSTGRRFDWNLVPDMVLAPSRHLQRLQSAKERQPAGRPSTLLKSVSALAPILMSSNSPRIGSTHAGALTNWAPRWVLSGAQRSQTSPSSPPVPDFSSVVWGKASRGVVWSNSLDWPVVVEVLVGVRKQEIEGPGLEQGTNLPGSERRRYVPTSDLCQASSIRVKELI
ncbi:hypothetical protein CCUS01_10125 [Colletotrichum cuscutae]|uniref:Uncharacterized protein n=1 Tax=Colletotrichum cuscutae TaxID=1209917 RepID=A0AAI9UG48_9PEZI|nr:hypothetical protein CCUS01_10125 [Colletotrichum cuscutae]